MGINRNSPVPITDQVEADLRRRIAAGEITDRLPSLKALASDYGVAPMTVQAVIKDLQRDGVVATVTGRGTFVRSAAGTPDDASDSDELVSLRRDMDEMRVRLDALERVVETGGSS